MTAICCLERWVLFPFVHSCHLVQPAIASCFLVNIITMQHAVAPYHSCRVAGASNCILAHRILDSHDEDSCMPCKGCGLNFWLSS